MTNLRPISTDYLNPINRSRPKKMAWRDVSMPSTTKQVILFPNTTKIEELSFDFTSIQEELKNISFDSFDFTSIQEELKNISFDYEAILSILNNVSIDITAFQNVVALLKHYQLPQLETKAMPQEYIDAAMRHAVVDWLPNDQQYYGEIPGFQGVYGLGATLEAARAALQSALTDWSAFRLTFNLSLPNPENPSENVDA